MSTFIIGFEACCSFLKKTLYRKPAKNYPEFIIWNVKFGKMEYEMF